MIDYLKAGFTVLAPKQTFESKGLMLNNSKIAESLKGYKLGNFKVVPFDLNHDVPCNGYIIDHADMGRLIFITDTYLCKYKFSDVKHWLIEANYSDEILDGRNCAYKNRVYTSHLSIDNTKGILKANDLSKTNTIILCHLSDGNSNEKKFISDIQRETGIITIAADRNVQIELTNV